MYCNILSAYVISNAIHLIIQLESIKKSFEQSGLNFKYQAKYIIHKSSRIYRNTLSELCCRFNNEHLFISITQ